MRTPRPRAATARARASRALAALLVCVETFAAASGCGQRTRIEGAPADSGRSALSDSATRRLRDAQSAWDATGGGEVAAGASAVALLADLRARDFATWETRTRVLLDSLAIGAETAVTPGVLAVNFFSRSDPDAGSWPYLYWSDGRQARHQAIEGAGLHLQSAVARGAADGAGGVAMIFGRRVGGGQQPLVMAWSHPRSDAPWSLAQTLGADSLGGVGTAEFQASSDSAADLVVRTFTGARGFEECAMCPHIYRTRRFHWGAAGFARVEDQTVSSPYATFVQFVQALVAGDDEAAQRRVTDSALLDRARRLEWNRTKGLWRAAPETDESAQQMVFYRGKDEAYRVEFAQRGTDWAIRAFEPTSRAIE